MNTPMLVPARNSRVRDVVADVFREVAAKHNRRLTVLNDEADLFKLGLDSLCLAIIVSRLETRLGRDPFNDGIATSIPETFGEFVDLYRGRT